MIHTIHITPIHISTSTPTTTTSRIRLGSSSFMRIITLAFITLSLTTSHVIATETHPSISSTTDNVSHPALPEIPSFHQLDASEYGSETLISTHHERIIDTRDAQEYGSDVPNIHTRLEIPTETHVTDTINTSGVTETIIPSEPNPVAEVNDQYNTTYATPSPKTSTHAPIQQELLPSASLAQRSPDEIAWATVVYDSASSTGSLSVVNTDTQNTTHPYVHVRSDELHGQYGASSNPTLLRKTAEYEKQKAARDAAAAKHGVDPAIQQAGLDTQYGIQRPRHHHQQDHEQDASHAAVDDETNGKVSIETALIANGTWVLPNIVEKEAAKWTDAAYGSAPAEQIKAQQVVDDSPVEAILKDEATRAAAAAAAAEIVSLEALELAELASRAALEKSSLQSFQDATHDAQRAADAELVDEIIRENEYVRHSKQRIDKQLAREAYLREQTRQQKLHELEELNHQHRIVDGETEPYHDAADEVHGQYGTEANPDVLSKQAEEAELANQKEYTSPPIDAGTEYGDKLVITHESYETERDIIITPHVDEDEKDRKLPSDAYAIVNGSIPVPAINETEEAVITDSEYGSSIETLSQGDHIQHIAPMERVIPKVTSYGARPNSDMKHYSNEDMIIPQVDSASRAFPNVASQDESIAVATAITPEIPSVDPNRIVADPIALADVSVPRSADDMPAIKFSLADIPTLAHEAELQASTSSDPFTDLPNFSLAGHLDQLTRLITDSEADFMAMSVTGDGGTTAPPTVMTTTAPPTDVVPGNPIGNAGLNIAPEILNITIPAPSTARCHFNYKGLYPDTPLKRGVNTSLIASFFRIKCTPDNTKAGTVPVVQADGQASPIDVTGLDGTVSYICTAAAITPAFGQSPWSKNFPRPIQTGQLRTSLRLFVPYNETCGSPKVYHFHTQFKKQICSAMKIMEAELTIVSCRRDYMGMTLVTIAFTFESQYKSHVHSVGHAMRTKSNVITTPTSLTAQEKRDRLRDLMLTPGSSLFKDSTYTQSIDINHWSTEQRDLGHDMCTDQGACSHNDYCYNGHETTYQCQCDISHSTRSCFDTKQTCAPPRCLTERSLSRGLQPIADCSVYTIKIALDLHTKLDPSKSQATQASELIAHLADVTSTAPSVFQFIGFSTNVDGTTRAELNVLQNGNRSTSCIVKDLQYQKMDIRTPLMTAMADEMGGLNTLMKQCEDGTYAEVCEVSARQPWYMFWIYVGMIILGTILGLTLIYLFALRACIHIFPGPMAAFAAKRHRIPGINEKKLTELQQRHAMKRKQEEAAANGIYDITNMDEIGDSCVESDFHSGMSGDERNAIHKTKTKNGQVSAINNGSVRPETARTDIKPLVLPEAPNTESVTKPKRFARWRQRSTTGNGIVPINGQGQITDLPSPSHRMQVLDLSVAGDASPIKRSWFGRKTISQRRASFKMPEFSVSPLEDGTTTPPELDITMDEPLQTFEHSIVTRGQNVSSAFNPPSSTVTPTHRNTPSVSQLSVSRLSSNSVSRPMGPQSTAWTAEPSVSRTSSSSISHRSQPSVSAFDPRVLAPAPRNPAASVSQALAFAQASLHEDVPTIDTTPIPVITRSSSARPTSIESARGLRRRSSSISHSMIGRVIYSSDSDQDAIRPISTSVSRLAVPSRSGVSSTTKAAPVVIPNGYNSGMDSPAEDSSDHEYSQRSEYSHL